MWRSCSQQVYPTDATCQDIDLQGTYFPQDACDPGYAVVHEGLVSAGHQAIEGLTVAQAKLLCCQRSKVRLEAAHVAHILQKLPERT